MLSAELRRQRVDVLLNVHSLYLINAEVLAAPRIGSFNLHPGTLPEYAGRNVSSWAIYHGETSHGVTLRWLAPRVDTVGAPEGGGIRVAVADEWVVIRRLRIGGKDAAPAAVLSTDDALVGGGVDAAIWRHLASLPLS